MAKITWKLNVKGERNSSDDSHLKALLAETIDIEGNVVVDTVNVYDPQPKLIEKTDTTEKAIPLPSRDYLNMLLILPQFVNSKLSEREACEAWCKVEYTFSDVGATCAPDCWNKLRGPQFFANGAAEWLPERGCLWIKNESGQDLLVQVVAATGGSCSDCDDLVRTN